MTRDGTNGDVMVYWSLTSDTTPMTSGPMSPFTSLDATPFSGIVPIKSGTLHFSYITYLLDKINLFYIFTPILHTLILFNILASKTHYVQLRNNLFTFTGESKGEIIFNILADDLPETDESFYVCSYLYYLNLLRFNNQ